MTRRHSPAQRSRSMPIHRSPTDRRCTRTAEPRARRPPARRPIVPGGLSAPLIFFVAGVDRRKRGKIGEKRQPEMQPYRREAPAVMKRDAELRHSVAVIARAVADVRLPAVTGKLFGELAH